MKEKIYGARYSPTQTVFQLWAPSAWSVELNTYPAGSTEEDSRVLGRYPMERGENGVFTLRLPGDQDGLYYDYVLHGQSGAVESADPWAVACGINGERSMVVNLAATNPPGWEQDRRVPPQKCAPVIWETHVKDFSYDLSSGVRQEWRGKYLAFTEPDTVLGRTGTAPTCVSYLKKLGVTHVQLQPIADYCSVDERRQGGYNWGYDIENYNIPEGSYATDPYHGAVRIRECKQMIQALHKAGIGVILDVVYNHTYRRNSFLARTAPGEYYRHAPDGSFMNASGCGNETASEREPFRNYMVQSVLYWAREYHVDGFRFDLMAVHDVETMNLIREELDRLPGGKDILLYGEPWAALAPDLHAPNISANKEALPLLSDRIGVFSDATRDTVNGSVFNPCEAGGYAGGWIEDWMEKSVKSAVCGWCRKDLNHYTKSPTQLVQYVSSHDNYTLWDSLTLRAGDGDFHRSDAERIQRVRLTSGIYLTSVGLAFFQSGEEFGRTKEGCGNSYNGPAVRNRLDWALTEQRKELVDWYRGLIGLRKELVRREELTVDYVDHITFLSVPDSCVGFVTPEKTGTIWKRFVIFYNPHRDRLIHTNLPEGVWELLCDGENSLLWQQARPATCTGAYQLPPCSVIIFGERA